MASSWNKAQLRWFFGGLEEQHRLGIGYLRPLRVHGLPAAVTSALPALEEWRRASCFPVPLDFPQFSQKILTL